MLLADAALTNLNVVEILRVGLAGLCFLLSLLAFWLIRLEQQRKEAPRPGILRATYVFMLVNLAVAILVATAAQLGKPDVSGDVTDLETQMSDVQTQLDEAQGLNSRYRETLTGLAANIDTKVKFELAEIENGNIQAPAIKVFIDQLNTKIQRARDDQLIAPLDP